MSTLVDTALHYAHTFGWAVHPVDIKKQPTTKHGRNDATRDEPTIRSFFRNGAQIGVATGPESNLFVLDVDLDEKRGINGYETLEYLETIHGALPPTPRQRTGRGGMQYLFNYVEGLKNSTGKIGAGIDTRGRGGYVVVAPSRNTNGPYEWIVSPEEAQFADVPQWLIDLLREADTAQTTTTTPTGNERTYCLKMLGQAVARAATANDGQKHETLLKMATWMGGFVPTISETEIESALFAAIELRADDPAGARKTIQDGIAYGKTKPLTVPPLREQVDTTTGEIVESSAKTAKPASAVLRSETVIQTLLDLGYSFRLNLCDDTIEVNGRAIDNVVRATLLTALHDRDLKGRATLEDTWTAAAAQAPYHPIKDYLNACTWDGKPYIEELAGYFTCTDQPIMYHDGSAVPLVNVYLWRWLIGAVAKVFEQAQNLMLVMAGPQGSGKSSFVRWLCKSIPQAHIESPITVGDRDTDVRLMRYFLWEVSELDATTRKADVSALKAFITKQTVNARKAYGHYDTVKPASASLFGTVNDGSGFLADETGNRRFYVTTISAIDWRYTTLPIDQVWGQAVALWRKGEPWQLQPNELQAQIATNKQHEIDGLLDDWIQRYFILAGDADSGMSGAEIVDYLRKNQDIHLTGSGTAQAMEIARVMAKLGIKRRRRGGVGVREYIGVMIK